MPYSIAIAGKGGTGKTTISALTVRYLSERLGKSVLAVDADPNSNLGLVLGIEPEHTVAEIREEAASSSPSISPGMSKQRHIEYMLQRCVTEAGKFDLLTMGRPEGPKCYCYANHLLRSYLDQLSGDYGFMVADNEAGMEHLSRRTTSDVDLLVIVAEPTVIGARTAVRIVRLAAELAVTVRRKAVLINKVGEGGVPDEVKQTLLEESLEIDACIPYDDDLLGFASRGEALTALPAENPVFREIGNFLDRAIVAQTVGEE